MAPRSLISRLVEFAFLFALSGWLLKRGITYLLSIWPVLAVLGGIMLFLTIVYRIRKHRRDSGMD